MMGKVNRHKFNINLGLKPYDKSSVELPAICLIRVNHLDMDSAIVGSEVGTRFVKPTLKGFIFLSDLVEIAKAYDEEELYTVEGNY